MTAGRPCTEVYPRVLDNINFQILSSAISRSADHFYMSFISRHPGQLYCAYEGAMLGRSG